MERTAADGGPYKSKRVRTAEVQRAQRRTEEANLNPGEQSGVTVPRLIAGHWARIASAVGRRYYGGGWGKELKIAKRGLVEDGTAV